jgi:hypothetical protein
MPYLNLDLDYFDHPKTVRLVGLLGRGADLLPIRLWSYCGKFHAENGELTGYSPEEIEAALKWWGQPGRALEALLRPFKEKPGFLERIESGYKVHDWEKINGHIAALKERATAAANARWDKYRSADAQALPKHSLSNAPGNALSFPSLPNHKEEDGGAPSAAPDTPGRKPPKAKKPPKSFAEDSIPMQAARFMWSYVREWSPSALEPTPAGYQAWARDVDLMFRLDGRTPAAFNELLDWIDSAPVGKSGFTWRKNALCPDTLRARWKEGKFADFLPSELRKEEFR